MENPFREFLTDEHFDILLKRGFLNKVRIRNLNIKTKYKKLRAQGMKSDDAIELINQEYPYVTFTTIKKVVNKKGL